MAGPLIVLPLFVSTLVGVCPSCKWTIKQTELGEGELAVTYKTAAFFGQSQVGTLSDDGFWVADMANNRAVLLDTASNVTLLEIPVGRNPVGIAEGFGAIWTANYSDGTVTRINRGDRSASSVIDIGGKPLLIAVSDEAVWVTDQDRGVVSRINPQSNTLEKTINVGSQPVGIAAGPSGVWIALYRDNKIIRVDPATNKVVSRISASGDPLNLTLTETDLWVTNPASGFIDRIDLISGKNVAEIKVTGEPTGVAVDDQFAWVVRSANNDVVRISLTDNKLVGDPIPVGDMPKTIASDGHGGVWVMEEGAGRVSHIVPPGSIPAGRSPTPGEWLNDWTFTTVQTSLTMGLLGSPYFLIPGLISLSLALFVFFRLERRYEYHVPVWWFALLWLILLLPLLAAVIDRYVALSATAAAVFSFIAVWRLTGQDTPIQVKNFLDSELVIS